MKSKAVKTLALAAVFFPMLGVGEGPWVASLGVSAARADVSVYRGLQRKNATYAKVADAQFRIDDDGLSTFEAAEFGPNSTTRQCKLEFVIEGVDSQPAAGTHDNIASMAGYQGTYSPALGGAGHWSIGNTADVANTSAADFTAYALANAARITVNAAYTGNSNSQCNTPDAAN